MSQRSELDQWIKRGLDAEITLMDATFDFEVGLADVYARAGLARPKVTRSGVGTQVRGCVLE